MAGASAADEGKEIPVSGSFISDVLRERAGLQPNDTAFTFIDYEQDGTALPQV